MAAMLAEASYYRGGFSLCLVDSARSVMVPGGSTLQLEPGTIGMKTSIWNVCLVQWYYNFWQLVKFIYMLH